MTRRPDRREGDPPRPDGPDTAVARGFRSMIRGESTAFGFSIMITVTFGVVQHHQGSPGPPQLFLYAIGAVAGFTLLETIVTRGFRDTLPSYPSDVTSLGTAMNGLSVLAAVGVALGLAAVVDAGVAWLLCPFAAALTYLVAEALELVAAERIQAARGKAHAADVEE